ncbi:tonB-dependent receptor family protein [Asticcacaulis biprosthecium C19]|uniref:TonB-dependent receptor family protein n=2 Tax=Asticcacaulis biprosthecium TaxID=76891 RepID=F4QN76_9CAUL|nr:tonB-dependent receptor family protein [Asticcacaulis biprosthecium C19]
MNAALALALMSAPAAQAASLYDLDLPAQPLSKSLTEIGSQTHANVIFSPEAVAGRQARPLRGAYSTQAALEALLSGTGLGVSTTRGGSYIVAPLPAQAAPVVRPAPQPLAVWEAEPPQPVIVRGYRQSLTEAMRIKRRADGVVDVVLAEDMAKFPDNNLAEAIQRMPGVAITRDQGEGRSVTVRGLGPDFTRVEINGLEAQAATDGLAEGVNRGRGFDFNVFPSELFSRVDVLKTSSADKPEGSLGATVNLVTPHPLDRKGPHLAAGTQLTYNDLGDRSGARASVMLSNTFAGDRAGILVSAAWSLTPLDLQGVNSGGWNQGTADGGFCKPTQATGGPCDVANLTQATAAYNSVNRATTYIPRFYRYTDLQGDVERVGMTASAQWQPSQHTLMTLDLLYSQFRTQRTDHFLEAIGFSRGASQGGKPESVPLDAVVDGNNTLVYGRFDNVDVRSEVTIENFTTMFKQASFSLKHDLSDRLGFEGLFGVSYSKFANLEVSAQIDRFNVDGYSYDIRDGGQYRPRIDYGFDVSEPSNWYFGPRVTQPGGTGATGPELRLRPNYLHNGYKVAQARFNYRLNDAWRLTLGAEAKRYSFRSIFYRLIQGEANFPAPSVGIEALTKPFCGLSDILEAGHSPDCWRIPDIDAFITEYDLLGNTGRTALSTTNPAARGFNQAVFENDTSLYAQAEFRRTVWGVPVRGNIGVRQVRTDQVSEFIANVPVSIDPSGQRLTQVHRTYSDALPSLNIAADLNGDTVLRFSAAKVIARPPLASLAAETSVQVNGGARRVTTGNPYLEPYRAVSYDLSWEWYPTTGTVAAVGLFYKDISTYVQSLTHVAPYATTGLPAELLSGTGATVTDDFVIQRAVNTPGGPLYGVEITYQQPLRFLPGIWSGLGVRMNYTYANSQIDYFTTSALGSVIVTADLIYLSRNSANATLYYSKGRFEARVSANYRDEYLLAVPGGFNTDANGMDAATYIDASASYRVTDRLTLSLEGLNLTKETNGTWSDSVARRTTDYRLGGRRLHAGLRYSF